MTSDGLKTVVVSAVALVGYPLVGGLALAEANRLQVTRLDIVGRTEALS